MAVLVEVCGVTVSATILFVGTGALLVGAGLVTESFSTDYLGGSTFDKKTGLAGGMLVGAGVTFTAAWLAVAALRWQPPGRQ